MTLPPVSSGLWGFYHGGSLSAGTSQWRDESGRAQPDTHYIGYMRPDAMLSARCRADWGPCNRAGKQNHAATTGAVSKTAGGINDFDYVQGDTSTTVIWPEVRAGRHWVLSLPALTVSLFAMLKRGAGNTPCTHHPALAPRHYSSTWCTRSRAPDTQHSPSAGGQPAAVGASTASGHAWMQGLLSRQPLLRALRVGGYAFGAPAIAAMRAPCRLNGPERTRILDPTYRNYIAGFEYGCTAIVTRQVDSGGQSPNMCRVCPPGVGSDVLWSELCQECCGVPGYYITSWHLNTVGALQTPQGPAVPMCSQCSPTTLTCILPPMLLRAGPAVPAQVAAWRC